MTPQEFKEMFWAHFPPAVRELRDLNEKAADSNSHVLPMDVQAKAVELALAGSRIDPLIMASGLNVDPFSVMVTRQAQGYTWIPAMLEEPNYDLAPGTPGGIGGGGVSARPYDPDRPTKRYIPVSLAASDWPPFDEPIAAKPSPIVEARPDWNAVWGNVAGILLGDTSPAGTVYGAWMKMITPSAFGASAYWQKQ